MTREVEYDDRGNITKIGDLSASPLTFVYDMADQPRTVSGTNRTGESVSGGTYAYDGHFKRVKSVVNGVTRYNVYDKEGRLAHVEEGDDPATPNVDEFSETDYLHAAGMTLARIKNGVFTYMHPDHLGSASAGTKEDGSLAFTEFHTPFGESLLNPAANDNQSDFTGHIKDKDTGLIYMQARYFDPNIGRFGSVDPVAFTSADKNPRIFNRFSYTFNDPINLIDPDGMKPDHIMDRQMAGMVKTGRAIAIFSKHHKHAKEMTDGAASRNDPNTAIHGDKFEHFMANHEVVSKMGGDGAEIAKALGDAREVAQSIAAKLRGEENTGAEADQKSNAAGRESAKNGENAAEAGEAFVRENFNPIFEAQNEDTIGHEDEKE